MRGSKEIIANSVKAELTTREREIMSLLAEAWTYKQIAQRLHVSPETVKTHLKNIYRKLEASGKVDALNKFRSL